MVHNTARKVGEEDVDDKDTCNYFFCQFLKKNQIYKKLKKIEKN